MQWQDDGIVLGTRPLGENGLIAEVMTAQHGRHAGLVRGGRKPERQSVLQPGNGVQLVWRARLDAHLGQFQLEPLCARATSLMSHRLALHGFSQMVALMLLLPEREPHPELYAAFEGLADGFAHSAMQAAKLSATAAFDVWCLCAMQLARFELRLLTDLGFGLDLGVCALTGATQSLAYVSPKSGRAVSVVAGEPWRTKLLALPRFLMQDEDDFTLEALPSWLEIANSFRLTEHFLTRDVFAPRGLTMPIGRARFLEILASEAGVKNTPDFQISSLRA